MAKRYAKLSWTPSLTRAIRLDGSHYLSCAHDSGLNVGTGSFTIDVLHAPLAAGGPDGDMLLAGKGAASLEFAAGWQLWLLWGTRQYRLLLNDGIQPLPLAVTSAMNAFTPGTYSHVVATVDRSSGQASFLVNGQAAGGGSLALPALFEDDFETGDLSKWSGSNAVSVIYGVAGLTGACAHLGTDHSKAWKVLDNAIAQICLRLKFKPNVGRGMIAGFRHDALCLGGLSSVTHVAAPGLYLAAVRGNHEAVLAEAAAPLNYGTVYDLKIFYRPHTATGRFRVWVNNTPIIDFTGAAAPTNLGINLVQAGGG